MDLISVLAIFVVGAAILAIGGLFFLDDDASVLLTTVCVVGGILIAASSPLIAEWLTESWASDKAPAKEQDAAIEGLRRV